MITLVETIHELFNLDEYAEKCDFDPPTKQNVRTAYEILLRLYRKFPFEYGVAPCLDGGVSLYYSSITTPRCSILFSICEEKVWVGINMQGENFVKRTYNKPGHIPNGFIRLYMNRIREQELIDIEKEKNNGNPKS